MKVGLLLNDSGLKDMDLSTPECGNPGIGGTQFCFLMLARYLLEADKNAEVYIFHYSANTMPKCTDIICATETDVLNKVVENSIDCFVLQNGQKEELYNEIDERGISTVVWAHNYIGSKEARVLADKPMVKRVVCVGRQEYDRYIDHPIINKMTFIYNMFCSNPEIYYRNVNYSLRVTYTGSLIPAKGFHVLAKVWKKVVKRVPNAKLSVIGGGNLYSRDAKLGSWGIADSEYEKEFMPYLLDDNGQLLPSVHFHGVLGQEKIDIYRDTAVGIINPTAVTETFGLSAVEMEACGIPIVAKKRYGLIDTIKHDQTGYLFNNETEFLNYVVTLLSDRKQNDMLGRNGTKFVKDSFSPEIVINQWTVLFNNLEKGIDAVYIAPSESFTNDYKIIRVLNRLIRKICPVIPSTIDWKSR